MMRLAFHLFFSITAVFFYAGDTIFATEQYAVTVERNMAVKMRDGVVLRADIYRPKALGKFPVFLQRTPYNKSDCEVCPQAAARGYITIIQDCRGRYASEGEWIPFKDEQADGYDTVEWAAALPYSDGRVGMFGSSYVGVTQMLAAITAPPHLAGIFPSLTASNYHNGWIYQGGAFEQWFSEAWTTILAEDTFSRCVRRAGKTLQWVRTLPLAAYPILDTCEPINQAPYFREWLEHPSYDDYWKQWSIEAHHTNIVVPGYHVGGWYDIFLGGTLRNYMGIKAQGGSEAARRGQRLLVGPWYHGPMTGKTGDINFGSDVRVESYGDYLALDWYDHLFKGVDNNTAGDKPVKIFVMGKNIWREEEDWPLARARNTRFFLHSSGQANSLNGGGTLSPTAPQVEPADKYAYDPDDPVPTRGGALCCYDAQLASGAFDQRAVELRSDVLVYTTPVFKEECEVTGPVSLELYSSSSAVDTDFTAKLVDVWPNGYAQNLTDGIQRARYRNSQEKPELMNPGEIYRLTVDLCATSNVFLPGHQLRVEISSSNFPRFDRNLNTGDLQGHTTYHVKATNTIYHDGKHPSALLLPVVPR